AEILKIGVLCSDAEIAGRRDGELSIDGSPTEGALLVAALKGGVDIDELRAEYPRIDRIDRGDGRRYMVTVHRGPEGLLALAKGAPDEILEMSSRLYLGDGVTPLDEEKRADLRQQNADMAGKAMRVLAFARKQLPEGYGEADLFEGFDWCGLAGLVDPIRPAAPEALRALHRAGIRTVMITGDQAATAAAVARQLGLLESGPLHLLEAGDLASLDREVLRGLVPEVEAFARIPPEMKLAIVKALQANGDVVAMTGDGVNDAPALRAADVGVAMGQRGTELARELADVVLSTDDFSKMVDAVEEGRLVRANVRRVLHYLFSTNASEVWVVALSVALGLPSPLTPAQLLWLNLISDLAPALGLATEPSHPDLMKQPPQDPHEPIVPPALQRRILGESAALAAGSLLAYSLGLLRHGPGPRARTMAFWSLATAQLLHVPMARAGELPVLRYGRPFSRALALGFGASALLQAAVLLVPPLRGLLGGVSLALIDWLISLLAAVAPIAAIEIQRSATNPALPAPAEPTGEISPLKEAA
ncbi:MAG: cation-translocating P-type ATPase, partial [Chloroflexota bacterium]